MNITLIRHASVEDKYLGCYNGHIDISLSEKGLLEAKELKKQIDSNDYDAIYCSDLKRAKQTAEALDLSDIIYTDALREKSWGDNEGKNFDEIGIKYENFTQFIDALGGESVEVFTHRVKNFFYNVPSQEYHKGMIRWNKTSFFTNITPQEKCNETGYHENISASICTPPSGSILSYPCGTPEMELSNILVITHSGVIKTLLSLHENITLEKAFSKNIPYLSITRIKIENN